MAPELSIVIPAYNESRRIGATLEAAVAYLADSHTSGEIVVVDDGSRDDTAALVARYAESHPMVRLLRNDRNRGKGYTVRHGVLEARGDAVLFCDADGSTPMAEASKLLAVLEAGQADLAIGSRALPKSELARPQPWYRRAMGWGFRNLVRLIAIRGFRDTQCGFKAFRRDVAQAVFRRQTLDGFAFDVEVLFIARRLGYRVVEVPVRWLDSPDSRVRAGRDSARMLLDLFRIRVRALKGAYGSRR
jgi:dolichyl-phosphate beta-glucosyltransferase